MGILEVPFGRTTLISSPNGRYTLIGQRSQTPESTASIVLIDSISHRKTVVAILSRTAEAGWSPDGAAFFLQDDRSSDSTLAYIYELGSSKPIDIRERVLASYPAARNLSAGHAYYNVRRWMDAQHLLVSLQGHTDKSPVNCFTIDYAISRDGSVAELRSRLGSPYAPWCHS